MVPGPEHIIRWSEAPHGLDFVSHFPLFQGFVPELIFFSLLFLPLVLFPRRLWPCPFGLVVKVIVKSGVTFLFILLKIVILLWVLCLFPKFVISIKVVMRIVALIRSVSMVLVPAWGLISSGWVGFVLLWATLGTWSFHVVVLVIVLFELLIR